MLLRVDWSLKSVLKHFSIKIFIVSVFCDILRKTLMFCFHYRTINLWKSVRPVFKVKQSLKHFELLVRNKSIQDVYQHSWSNRALFSGPLAYTDCKMLSYLFHQVQNWNCLLTGCFHIPYYTYSIKIIWTTY